MAFYIVRGGWVGKTQRTYLAPYQVAALYGLTSSQWLPWHRMGRYSADAVHLSPDPSGLYSLAQYK